VGRRPGAYPLGNDVVGPAMSMSTAEPVDRETLPAGPLLDLLDYWTRRRGADLPPLSAIEPAEVPAALLRHLAVITARLPDGRFPEGRFKVLFTGSVPVMFGGSDPTGRFVDEIYAPAAYEAGAAFFDLVVSKREPVFADDEIGSADGADTRAVYRVRRLAVPFAGADGGVAAIAFAMTYQPLEAGGRLQFLREASARLVSRSLHPVAVEAVTP